MEKGRLGSGFEAENDRMSEIGFVLVFGFGDGLGNWWMA